MVVSSSLGQVVIQVDVSAFQKLERLEARYLVVHCSQLRKYCSRLLSKKLAYAVGINNLNG